MFKYSFFSVFFGHLISNSALCGRFIRTSRLFMGFGARLRFGYGVAIKALSVKGFRLRASFYAPQRLNARALNSIISIYAYTEVCK